MAYFIVFYGYNAIASYGSAWVNAQNNAIFDGVLHGCRRKYKPDCVFFIDKT